MSKASLILKALVIGSSLPATIWPLAGLGYKGRHLPDGTLDWLVIGLFFPILFGLTNILTVLLPGRKGVLQMFAIGAVMGLVSASTGTFIYNIPEIVYDLKGNERYLALVFGPVFYGVVWAVVVRWLNDLFGIPETLSGVEDSSPL